MKHVVMVVPVDGEIDKAQDIAQKDGVQAPQRFDVFTVRNFELQNHDGDEDGQHAIAEGLGASLSDFWVTHGLTFRTARGLWQVPNRAA